MGGKVITNAILRSSEGTQYHNFRVYCLGSELYKKTRDIMLIMIQATYSM